MEMEVAWREEKVEEDKMSRKRKKEVKNDSI